MRYTRRGSRWPNIAHSLSTITYNAGGRWLTLIVWPKWWRSILKDEQSMRYTYQGSQCPKYRASDIDLPPMRAADGSLLVSDQMAAGVLENGPSMRYSYRGSQGPETALNILTMQTLNPICFVCNVSKCDTKITDVNMHTCAAKYTRFCRIMTKARISTPPKGGGCTSWAA